MKELIMNNMEFIVTFTTMVVVWILGRISKKSKYVDENYKAAGPKESGIFDNIKNLEKYIPELSVTGPVNMCSNLF